MSKSRPPLSAALRSLEPTSAPGGHPPLEALWEYRSRSLPEKDRESIQEHLTSCPECVRVLLDMESFPDLEPSDPGQRLSHEDVRQDLERLQQRLADEQLEAVAAMPSATEATTPRIYRPWAWASVALMAFVVMGLLVRISSLESRTHELSRPQGEIVSVSLSSEATVVRGEGPEQLIEVKGDQGLHLSLEGYDTEEFRHYTAHLFSADGPGFEKNIHLRMSELNELKIWFPVPPPTGAYQIDLRGEQENKEKMLRTYRFRILLKK